MSKVGLDTGVVLRLLTGEPADQAETAYSYIETCYLRGISVLVSDLVVLETYHALCHHYEVPPVKATKVLSDFLSSAMISPSGHALAVVKEFKGTGAGFEDRLIRVDYLDHADEVVSFDQRFSRLPGVTKL
jgi:predicted nucleic-acid-binding protein